MFANCMLFATFCSIGTLVRRKKTWHYSDLKVMEFGQLRIDISVYVSCKVVFGVGVSCRNLYSFVVYLCVNGSGSITAVGEKRVNLSAVVYL